MMAPALASISAGRLAESLTVESWMMLLIFVSIGVFVGGVLRRVSAWVMWNKPLHGSG